MANRDYYEVLGVTRAAADHEIRKAYVELAKRCHPDRNPGDEEAERRFKDINEAYEALKDANRRAIYNHHLETEAEENAPMPEPTGSLWQGFVAVVIMILVLGGASILYYVFGVNHGLPERRRSDAAAPLNKKNQEQLGGRVGMAPLSAEGTPDVTPPSKAPSPEAPAAPPGPAPAPAGPPASSSAQVWEKVRDSNDLLALEDFVEKFRDSNEFPAARSRLHSLVAASEDIMALEALAQLTPPKVSSDLETPDLARKRIAELREASAARARDDSDWAAAQAKGDVESTIAYLRDHSNGQHALAAREWLAGRGLVEVHMGSKGGDAGPEGSSPDAGGQDRKGWFTAGDGQSFRDCARCPEMVIVPSGAFKMGSPESEESRGQSEGPRHEVRIAKPFAIGKYEVTFEEWDACVAGGGCRGYVPGKPGAERSRQPVSNISWDDAQAYVAWLRSRTGKPYRLPTEAEWEYAARAGTDTAYWWGAHIEPSHVNFAGERGGGPAARPSNVEAYEPNRWGLHQVAGNVWEWVEDCWHDTYQGAPSDGRAWREEDGGNCQQRSLRGGSWMSGAGGVRSAHRGRVSSSMRDLIYGLRIARDL
jgi:formylglycine-generating enzyme required for sulfatase activity